MLTVEAKTKDLEKWLNWAVNITTKINSGRVQDVSIESALQLGKEIAFAFTPFKTGRLRNSINWIKTGHDTGGFELMLHTQVKLILELQVNLNDHSLLLL